MSENDDIMIQELRRQDGDLFLCHLFVSTQFRPRILTLYKAYAEISSIPFDVSEPMLGHIRLQWWRDMIEDPSKNARDGVPIAQALKAYPQNPQLMKRLVDSRDQALSDDLSAEQEAEMAGVALMHLSCQAIEVDCDTVLLDTAGKGFELMRLSGADAGQVKTAAALLEQACHRFNTLSRRLRVSLIAVFMPVGLARRQAQAFPKRKSLLSYHVSLLKMAVTAKI